ncbi:MAG TPA: zinc ribbon domain-containing protein [Candidatus Lokiarchaeia archaeon]|nr:zinc ribbon domain-containing protein [Candidatus Lokiarchaeia archaeon]
MEQSHLDAATKNLKLTATFAIIILIIVAAIEILSTVINSIIGFDTSYYIGMGVATGCGIVVPIIIIVLSSVARVNMSKNPKLLFGMTIGILVLSLAVMAVFYGIYSTASALVSDISLAGLGSSAHARVIPMRVVSLVIILVIVPMAILMIVNVSKNLKIGQEYIQQAPASGTARVPPTPAKSEGTEEPFCAQCGAKNSAGAKFCKKCGQAL